MSKENSVDAMSTDNSDSVTSSEQEIRKSCTSLNKQRNTSMASSKSIYHKQCGCPGAQEDDLDSLHSDSANQKRSRRKRRRDPNKGKLETRLDIVKEDVLEDLLRILSGLNSNSPVETNVVANYFLASNLITSLEGLKKKTFDKIEEQIKPILYPSISTDEKEEAKLLCKLKRNRTQTVQEVKMSLTNDADANSDLARVLNKMKKDLTDDTEFAIKEVDVDVTENAVLDLKDDVLDQVELSQLSLLSN